MYIRAENVARIESQANAHGMSLRTEVFATREAWQNYAVESLRTVRRLAQELCVEDRLHLWPDKSLGSAGLVNRMPKPTDIRITSVKTDSELISYRAPIKFGGRVVTDAMIVNVTSDAGVQAYPTWGGYGASKAALEHLSRVLAAELEGTGVRVFVIDPGDMDTAMHRAAEPGVDLSHLPTPDSVAPAFVRLLDEEAAFGRFEAQRLVAVTA